MSKLKRPTTPAANHLRAWREYRGLTQEKLAELVGTAGNVISLLESGGRSLSEKWIRRLAPALGAKPSLLRDHDPGDLDDDILELWAALPPEERAEVREALEIFTGIPQEKRPEVREVLKVFRRSGAG